jgi:predicted DNA-binding transcriptional regulator AlpA
MLSVEINSEIYLPLYEVAERIGKSEPWIYEKLKSKRFPKPFKVTYRILWKESVIEEYINTMKQKAEEENIRKVKQLADEEEYIKKINQKAESGE